MKRFLLLSFFCCLTARAETPVKILKIFSNKREFVVQNLPGMDDDTVLNVKTLEMKEPAMAKVKVCKAKTCLAQLDAGIFELHPQKLQEYQCSIVENKYDSVAYLGYGSALGSAIKVGLRKEDGGSLSYGAYLTRISSKINTTEVTANALSFQAIYELFKIGDFTFNLNGELGYAFTLIKFETSTEGRSLKENVYVAGAALEALYSFGDRYRLGVNMGASKNGFKSSYAGSEGEFDNPYGTVLIYSEIGLHYQF